MGRLLIVATEGSKSARNTTRGKLFEDLMAQVLQHHGYGIDSIHRSNYAGMEIDIEGRSLLAGVPLYAECKAYDSPISSPRIQEFVGKYITRWKRDHRSVGLFIALPSLNSHAKGFYREHYEHDSNMTIKLLEEDEVLEAMFASGRFARPETVQSQVPAEIGIPGDWTIVHSDEGSFWLQLVICPDFTVAQHLLVFDQLGRPLTNKQLIDPIIASIPDFKDFELLQMDKSKPAQHSTTSLVAEEIVEVQGSSSWFEFQFPASPQFMVGRSALLQEVELLAQGIVSGSTSSRGILFEAKSLRQ